MDTRQHKVTKHLTASGATAVVPLFKITGAVRIKGLWGIVKTALGASVTAAYFRLNDQAAQLDITLNTGTTLSAAPIGTLIVKDKLAAVAVTKKSAATGALLEPAAEGTPITSEFAFIPKTPAANVDTDIEFVYTTADTPTSGVIEFTVEYERLQSDALVQEVP